MPLLHKKPFIKNQVKKNLRSDDKVFFCKPTQEVFTDYDEFWERLLLLNALVWSCEATGHSNLTYQEALDSEEKAKAAPVFPKVLRMPILYISSLTKRGRLNDAVDDIFNYIRDRYFVGEEVEAIVGKHWYDCKVVRVVMPTKEQIIEYEKALEESENEDEQKKPALVNGNAAAGDDEILVIRDDTKDPLELDESKNDETEKSSVKDKSVAPAEPEEYPPYGSVLYEVVEIEAWDRKTCKNHLVKWDQIRRPNRLFTREKCKKFVKQSLVLSSDGFLVVRDNLKKSHNLALKYNDVFVGDAPVFEHTPIKRMPQTSNPNSPDKKKGSDKSSQDKKRIDEQKKKEESKKINQPPVLTEEEKERIRKMQEVEREKEKKAFQERLEKIRMERKFRKDIEREEARLLKLYSQEWGMKKEDLLCEDHKDLPVPTKIESRIPQSVYGEFFMVLDFVNTFSETLDLQDVYPNGVTYEMLENALIISEVTGVFNDIVQLFLGSIFSLQEQEDEEIEGDTSQDLASMDFKEHLESKCQQTAVKMANQAATWSQQYQGVSLQKAPLDALTLTEILRIHILASGATNIANELWRHNNRGGYKHYDDPGMTFKLEQPQIIEKLGNVTLFDLSVEEKLKILDVLVCQIISYASVRDLIEDNVNKLRLCIYKFRMHKLSIIRKEKEEINARKQKLKDMKEQYEKKLQEHRVKASEASKTGETLAPIDTKVIEMEVLEEMDDLEEKEKDTRSKTKNEPTENEFLEQIEELAAATRQLPLGQDRAFRRYWLFNIVPGLFVEDFISEVGACLDYPTPVNPIVEPKDDPRIKIAIKEQAIKNVQIFAKIRELEKHDKNSSDKENENNEGEVKQNKPKNNNKFLSNKSDLEEQIVDYIATELLEETPEIVENIKEVHSNIFGLCSADETCPVHVQINRPKWTYFSSPEELDSLINSLNDRGIRESSLKFNLEKNRKKILESFQEFSSFKQYFDDSSSKTEDKKSLKKNLNFPPGTPVDRIFELTLRDMILETEEKIDNGMLGSIKVENRDAWRLALVDGISLDQLDLHSLDWGGKRRINKFKTNLGIEVSANFESGNGLPKDKSEFTIIKELAIAILLVGQGLNQKFLKGPLSESDKMRNKRKNMEERLIKRSKKRLKNFDENDNNNDSSSDEEETDRKFDMRNIPAHVDNILRTPFERWEKSLMLCSNLSQLCLHFATLDNSIFWSRSAALSRRCRVCRRSRDNDDMILCDQCDGGFHLTCLKPKLNKVPEGDWFCDKCKPKQKPKSPVKKQRPVCVEDYGEVSDDEIDNVDYCSACEQGGEIIMCDTCPRSFHLECADLRKIPRGKWSCPLCKEDQETPKPKKKSARSKKLKTDEDIVASLEGLTLKRGTKRALEEDDENDAEDAEFHVEEIEKVLNLILNHNDSVPFRKPVGKSEDSKYHKRVKAPMDLRTVKNKVNKNKYESDQEFVSDVLLIFSNAQSYYGDDTQEFKSSVKLQRYFLSKLKSSKVEYSSLMEEDSPEPVRKSQRRR